MGIKIEHLVRGFGQNLIFSCGPLYSQEAGLIVLTGSNGSGKTTFFKVLSTILPPTEGDVEVCGYSVLKKPEKVRQKIGFAPASDSGFFRQMTGRENLKLFGSLRGLSRQEIESAVSAWSDVFDHLKSALDIPFANSSAGMKQVLLICRALLHDPQVVLLDEPDRSLDERSKRALTACVKVLAQNKLVLVATHHPELWVALNGGDRFWKIENRKLQEPCLVRQLHYEN